MAAPTYRSSSTASRPAAARLTCAVVTTEAERRAHFRIRHQVFVIEQGLSGVVSAMRCGAPSPRGGLCGNQSALPATQSYTASNPNASDRDALRELTSQRLSWQ